MLSVVAIIVITWMTLNNAKRYPTITATDINNLRADIRSAIDASSFIPDDPVKESGDQPLIGSIVRLAFHDCAGRNIKQHSERCKKKKNADKSKRKKKKVKLTKNRCNGCFDFDEPDNFGLEEFAFNPLEDIYQTSIHEWYDKMSRADFWMAAATIALEYAAENQYIIPGANVFGVNIPSPLRDIPYYFGRKDCRNSPHAVEQGVFKFPSPNAGFDETAAWFAENLGFDENETVTIIGAHTLGRVHPEATGFVSQWVTFGNVLNNEFFSNLATEPVNFFGFINYVQQRVGNLELCTEYFSDVCDHTNNNYQWVLGANSGLVLNPDFGAEIIGLGINLNSDISLALRIEDYLDRETGIVSCTAPTFNESITGIPEPTRCPPQEGIYQIVNKFAFDNSIFMDAFADVFEKMILNGEKVRRLQKLIVPYDRSFQDTSMNPAIANDRNIIVDDLLRKNEDDSAINYIYYYIGSAIAALFCVIIIFCIVYWQKRKSYILLKQIEECNHSVSQPDEDIDGALTTKA